MMRHALAPATVAALIAGTAAAQPPAPRAVVSTDKGDFTLEFWAQDAPYHVKNFLDLARKGFYDGQRVHRVEPGGGVP
jgi:peptidyl-prolyl cis-trans isomerase B (cyclophilin B)